MPVYRCTTCDHVIKLHRTGSGTPQCPTCGTAMSAELPADFEAGMACSQDPAAALESLDEAANAEPRLDGPHAHPIENAPGAALAMGLGVASAAFSIVGAGLLPGIPAILVGAAALRRCRREPERYKGRSLAVVGTIVGVFGTAVSLLMLAILARGTNFFWPLTR